MPRKISSLLLEQSHAQSTFSAVFFVLRLTASNNSISGLILIDVSDPSNPKTVGHTSEVDYVHEYAASRYAYIIAAMH
jgi:hypothetical protein